MQRERSVDPGTLPAAVGRLLSLDAAGRTTARCPKPKSIGHWPQLGRLPLRSNSAAESRLSAITESRFSNAECQVVLLRPCCSLAVQHYRMVDNNANLQPANCNLALRAIEW